MSNMQEINRNDRIAKTEAIGRLLKDLIDLIGDVTSPVNEPHSHGSLSEDVRLYENARICEALRRANGSQRKAARLLGMNPTTLNYKIKRNGLDISPYCVVNINKK